jgi:hypothetical protein
MERRHFVTAAAMLAVSGLLFGCAAQTKSVRTNESNPARPAAVSAGAIDDTVVPTPGISATPLLARDELFKARPPVVVGWAPEPTFPQKNFGIFGRTVTPRVLATAINPAVPGTASFMLGWQSTGSPLQVFIYRQTWTLGATDTKEFTPGPVTPIASLGTLPNGYQTWSDPAPALNTRNCYFVKAGDGTYWSYSNTDCGYAPDPDHPHAVGKVAIRVKLSTASTAVTSSNVRVRLDYGVPGSSAGIVHTWLDAQDTPFYTPGGEATFMLRTPEIRDLSDMTMIRVEVPGNDGLCLNQLELIVDDATAFLKTSPGTQQCGNGNPFEWAWHSGYIDGTAVDIPFQELRNSSTWKGFSPFVFPGTVSASRPDGSSFVGYTPPEFRKKIDGITAHNLKDDGTYTGSSRRFRNGNNDVTSITWVNERTVRVQQHLRLADGGGCTVDAHPVFNLTIHPLNANGDPFDGTNGSIESTKITSDLLTPGIDQGGYCQLIPGVNAYIQLYAIVEFGKEFSSAGSTDAGKPPANMRFCFPNVGLSRPFTDFDNGGLSLCFGAQ